MEILVLHLKLPKKELDAMNEEAAEWVRVEKAKAIAGGKAGTIQGQYAFGALVATVPSKPIKKRAAKKPKLEKDDYATTATTSHSPHRPHARPIVPEHIPYIAAFDPRPAASTYDDQSSPEPSPSHSLLRPPPFRPLPRRASIPWRVWAEQNLPPPTFEEDSPVLRGGDATITTLHPTPRRSPTSAPMVEVLEGGLRRSYTHAYPQMYPNPLAYPVSPPLDRSSTPRSGFEIEGRLPPMIGAIEGLGLGWGEEGGEEGVFKVRRNKLPSIRRWFPVPESMEPARGTGEGVWEEGARGMVT